MPKQSKQKHTRIEFYRTTGKYGCFSNFSRDAVVIDGKKYPTSEHYYQSMKANDPVEAARIASAATPRESKNLASACRSMRKDWDQEKENVMMKVLRAKFTQNDRARAALLSTGEALLVERSDRDSYWGDGKDRNGQNRLGKLLMQLRGEITSA